MDVQDDTQGILALQELNSNLKSLSKQLNKMPSLFVQLNSDLKKYTSALSDAQGDYSKLNPSEQDAINKINDTLASINKLVIKEEKKENRRAQKSGTAPDKTAMDSLKKITNAVITSSGYLRAYLKSAPKDAQVPRAKGLGRREDTSRASRIGAEIHKTQSDVPKLALTLAKKLIPSLRPTANKSLNQPVASDSGADGISKFDVLSKSFSMFGSGLISFNSAIATFVGAMGSAYSAVAEGFGNILDSPLSSVVSAMNGMTQMVTSSMSFISSILETMSGIISSLITPVKDDEGGGGLSKGIGAIASTILGIITSIITIAIQAIQSGFQIFASTLQAVFKIVKKIALTSPIVKAILDLLNLAFTLFFMPFMNSFALVLLPYVLDLLNWAVENGNKYAELGATLGESFSSLLNSDSGILEKVKAIATKFIEDFLPKFLELLPDLMDFAVDFVKNILNNSQDIIDFLESGFDAFSAMLDAGILKSFLKLGVDVMNWLGSNAPSLVKLIASVLEGVLRIATFFGKFTGADQSDLEKIDIDSISKEAGDMASALEKINNTSTKDGEEGDAPTTLQEALEAMNTPKASAGGKFAYNGGIPVIAGEGGEGEYKLSETELKEIGKDTTVAVQFNGQILSKSDFKTTVRRTLTDVSKTSYYR